MDPNPSDARRNKIAEIILDIFLNALAEDPPRSIAEVTGSKISEVEGLVYILSDSDFHSKITRTIALYELRRIEDKYAELVDEFVFDNPFHSVFHKNDYICRRYKKQYTAYEAFPLMSVAPLTSEVN